jgi:hypothetical protein
MVRTRSAVAVDGEVAGAGRVPGPEEVRLAVLDTVSN